MNSPDQTTPLWRKSSRSGGSGGECVEVAVACGRLLVRDSKHPDGPVLTLRHTTLHPLLSKLRTNTH